MSEVLPDTDQVPVDATSTAAIEDSRSRRRPTLLRAIVLLLLPGAACLGFGVDLAFRGNGIDPFIYVGITERLHDFLLRFRNLYFAYRFGYVLPEWLFERAFGQRGGYLALRFLLLGLVAVLLVRRARVPFAGSIVAAVFLAVSPIMHRAVFTTYPESLAFLFLMLGAVILAPVDTRSRDVGWCLVGGVALGLAWNAHLATLALSFVVVGVVGVDCFIERRGADIGRQARNLVAIGLGTVAVIVAGVLVYGGLFGVWNVYGPTIKMAGEPTNKVFIETHTTWFTWRHYLLVLPLSVLAGLVAWLRSTDDVERRVLRRLVAMVALSTLVFAYLEWGRNDAIFSVYYYSSFPLALALVLIARSIASAFARTGRERVVLAALGAGAILLPFATATGFKPRYLVVASITLVVAAAAWVLARQRVLLAPVLIVLGVLATFVSVSSPHDFPGATEQFRLDPSYDMTMFQYDWSAFGLYQVADDYSRALPSLPHDRGELRVWFDNDPRSITNQVQSTLVHYYSALEPPSDTGPPNLAAFSAQRLATDRPRFVVILDTSEADVEQGVQAIARAGEPYEQRWTKRFHHGSITVFAALLERQQGTWRDYPCKGADDVPVVCN